VQQGPAHINPSAGEEAPWQTCVLQSCSTSEFYSWQFTCVCRVRRSCRRITRTERLSTNNTTITTRLIGVDRLKATTHPLLCLVFHSEPTITQGHRAPTQVNLMQREMQFIHEQVATVTLGKYCRDGEVRDDARMSIRVVRQSEEERGFSKDRSENTNHDCDKILSMDVFKKSLREDRSALGKRAAIASRVVLPKPINV
jgi:hypothetical protein